MEVVTLVLCLLISIFVVLLVLQIVYVRNKISGLAQDQNVAKYSFVKTASDDVCKVGNIPRVYGVMVDTRLTSILNNNTSFQKHFLDSLERMTIPLSFLVDNDMTSFDFVPYRHILIALKSNVSSSQLVSDVQNNLVKYVTWGKHLYLTRASQKVRDVVLQYNAANPKQKVVSNVDGYQFLLLLPLPAREDVALKQPSDVNVSSFLGRSLKNQTLETLPENLYLIGYSV